jgi:hypothetical protein
VGCTRFGSLNGHPVQRRPDSVLPDPSVAFTTQDEGELCAPVRDREPVCTIEQSLRHPSRLPADCVIELADIIPGFRCEFVEICRLIRILADTFTSLQCPAAVGLVVCIALFRYGSAILRLSHWVLCDGRPFRPGNLTGRSACSALPTVCTAVLPSPSGREHEDCLPSNCPSHYAH